MSAVTSTLLIARVSKSMCASALRGRPALESGFHVLCARACMRASAGLCACFCVCVCARMCLRTSKQTHALLHCMPPTACIHLMTRCEHSSPSCNVLTGDQTEKEAFLDAISTWPEGVRPVVHWSESQEGRIAHAHSDYIYVRPSHDLIMDCWLLVSCVFPSVLLANSFSSCVAPLICELWYDSDCLLSLRYGCNFVASL